MLREEMKAALMKRRSMLTTEDTLTCRLDLVVPDVNNSETTNFHRVS